MKLEKFLFEVFKTCLYEEDGSTEHITEHVTHEDVIDIAKQLGLNDIARKFKRISKLSENEDDSYDDWKKLEKIVYKEYFDAIDKIYPVIMKQPKERFLNPWDEEGGFCKKLHINKKIGNIFVTDVILCDDEDTRRFSKNEDLLCVRYKNTPKDEEDDEFWFDSDYSNIIIKIAENI